MEFKYSPEIQYEINHLLETIKIYKNLFSMNIEYYIDGWAIFLKEKKIYPRSIVIFKSYHKNSFSIKSFEIKLYDYKKEEYKELYSIKNLENSDQLIKELKEIIYGKDIIKYSSKNYFDKINRN